MVVEDRAERRDQGAGIARGRAGAVRGDVVDQESGGERLHRLPAVEGIAVMRGEEGEVAVAPIGGQLDRGREAAVEGEHRSLG